MQLKITVERHTRLSHVFLPLSAIFLVVSLLSGCDNTSQQEVLPSDGYYASDILATIKTIQESDTSYRITAQFRTGNTANDSYLRLAGQDYLLASKNGPVAEMTNVTQDFFNSGNQLSDSLLANFKVVNLNKYTSCSNFFDCLIGSMFGANTTTYTGKPEYYAYPDRPFPQDIYLSFMRDTYSIADAHLVMPDSFDITMPSDGDTLSRSSDITVTWSPSSLSDNIRITATLTDCSSAYVDPNTTDPLVYDVVGDPGIYTLSATDLQAIAPSTTSPCDWEIQVERFRTATIDNFKTGSSANAIQRRKLNIKWE